MSKVLIALSARGPVVLKKSKADLSKGLSLFKIMKTTPSVFKSNANNVVVKSLKQTTTRSGKPAIRAVTKDMSKTGRVHKCHFIALDSAKPVYKSKQIFVSCDCVSGDTKVLTDKGYVQIFDIAEPYVPGHYPISYNINGTLHKGSAPFYKGSQPTYEVKFSNGLSIKATANHEFLVDGGFRYEQYFLYGNGPKEYSHSKRVNHKDVWVELRNLKVGDKVVLNSFEHTEALDTEKLYDGFFLGVIMGDGSVPKASYSKPDLNLYKHDLDEIVEVLSKSGTIETVAANEYGSRVTFNHRSRELLARYKFDNKKHVDLSNYSVFIGYVAGLFVTDGSVQRNSMKFSGGDYLKHMQELFLTFGFHDCSLVVERKAGTTTNLCTSTKDMYRLSLGVSSIRKLLPLIRDMLTSKKFSKLEKIANRPTQERKPTTSIIGISYVGKKHVYDIDVPGPTRFSANGVIVHNCEAFTFWCEYALTKYGASSIKFSNGEPPVDRNPSELPMICKHLVALAQTCKEYGL